MRAPGRRSRHERREGLLVRVGVEVTEAGSEPVGGRAAGRRGARLASRRGARPWYLRQKRRRKTCPSRSANLARYSSRRGSLWSSSSFAVLPGTWYIVWRTMSRIRRTKGRLIEACSASRTVTTRSSSSCWKLVKVCRPPPVKKDSARARRVAALERRLEHRRQAAIPGARSGSRAPSGSACPGASTEVARSASVGSAAKRLCSSATSSR